MATTKVVEQPDFAHDSGLGPLEVYRRAVVSFDAALHQLKDEQWHATTPCTEWDVRQLVNHVVGENSWLPALLQGLTIEEVGSQFDGDLLGADPMGAWSAASAAAIDAAGTPGALDRTVHLSFGETAATEYVWQVAADHVIHAWDLAVAIGADNRIDAGVVNAMTTWFAGNEAGYRSAGAIAERPELGPGAGPQSRLLAMFGRTPVVPDPLRTVAHFGSAFDAHDVDAVMAMMTEDCVFESTAAPDGVRAEGQAAVRAAWTAFFAASADARFTVEDIIDCDERVVVTWRYDWSGETPGHVRGVDLFTVRDGLVAEKASYVKG